MKSRQRDKALTLEINDSYQEKNEEQTKRQSSDKEATEDQTKRQSIDTEKERNVMMTLLELLLKDD